MGLDIFEEIVASWLQTEGYFMMNNIKYGNNKEIDILATKLGRNDIIHIEVQCSSNPQSILGRNDIRDEDYQQAATDFAEKKFFNQEVKEKILALSGQEPTKRWFIHAMMREPRQLEVFRQRGVETIDIKKVVESIKSSSLKNFSGDKRIKQLFDIIKD